MRGTVKVLSGLYVLLKWRQANDITPLENVEVGDAFDGPQEHSVYLKASIF